MNPARTLASALPSGIWTAFWAYVVAPLLGMLLAAEAHLWRRGAPVICAKLHHDHVHRCIFRCGYAASSGGGGSPVVASPAATRTLEAGRPS